MDEKTLFERIEKLRLTVWKRRGVRAPHKPLLLLLALGRVQRGEGRLVLYEDLRNRLKELLQNFGPHRKSYHPEHPFWHLRTDELWEIPDEDLARIRGGLEPSRSPTNGLLRSASARGGLPTSIEQLLRRRPELIPEAARRILDGHFARSLHEEISESVGLVRDTVTVREGERLKRDPNFRHAVLRAYERRCVICNFDMRIDDNLVALEAAHIKLHAAGGPDEVPNGLALCALHHRTFDRGAIGLDQTGDGFRLIVSDLVNGQSEAIRSLLAQHGRPIRPPQRTGQRPHPEFVAWHRKTVFRGTPRER